MATRTTKTPVKQMEKPAVTKTKLASPIPPSPSMNIEPVPKSPGKSDNTKPAVKRVARNLKARATTGLVAKINSETKEKIRKIKFIRDSFTMPENEYAALGELKKTCIDAGVEVKKSELFRVALVLLKSKTTAELHVLLDGLPPLKQGRPKKHK